MKQNEEIKISGLTSLGDGVGRHNGLTVFVPGALPGETVRISPARLKKNYARADLIEILESAPERISPLCPVYNSCGGCCLQHLDYNEQLLHKQQWLADALQRLGGLTLEVKPTIAAKAATGYRNRVQLHAKWQGSQFKLGFYKQGSHELTEGGHCLLMRPILAQLSALLGQLPPNMTGCLSGLRHIALRCDSLGESAMLVLVGVNGQAKHDELGKLAGWLMKQEARLVSIWTNTGRAIYGIYGEEWHKIAGQDKLFENCGDLCLHISAGAFTQINAAQAQILYGQVAFYAALDGSQTVLDAYCGVGAIALFLADKAQAVMGVEEYAPAVADAQSNAILNGINNCRFIAGRVEGVLPLLAAQNSKIQVAVLDPPRSGCATAALKALAKLKPRRIIYVSCDPATLARDARLLKELGYIARIAQPLDMFPHTGHVEAIVLLQQQ
ncbi:MAG: 23S rRNA (uracil(1939)-C(5))-methyltransferase RlmD [Clostridiales bacterium]|nr:23S rRNA (uracil(1939)-C(5))-methyltransferase RlmD [Clostridiales bacterium]